MRDGLGQFYAGLLALLVVAAFASDAAAQGAPAPLPERRVTVEPGVDFYGSDLRSIYGTTLPICRDACLAESACSAFTFNTKASACFLKSDDGARTPFPAALSATLAPQPDGLAARAAARAATLGFLAPDAARRRRATRRSRPASRSRRRSPRRRSRRELATLRGEVNATDSAAAWSALAGYAAGAEIDGLEPEVRGARPRGRGRDQRLPAGRRPTPRPARRRG